MATMLTGPRVEPIEPFEPSQLDTDDILGIRAGVPFRLELLREFKVDTQLGTIWLGTWGLLSVAFFLAGGLVLFCAALDQTGGNLIDAIKYFANVQELPPDGLGWFHSPRTGGYWELNILCWAGAILAWAGRCYDRLRRHQWRPYLLYAWLAAISLTSAIWIWHPLLMGTWADAPGLGLNSDLDWAQNFSVLWGNFYYNPWHQLAIFFLFGSTMLWGMHGATILATGGEASHHEDAEIIDMHSGSHKSMLFWRWTMGFNANPKTIHDWLWWFGTGTVLASVIGILTTGTVTNDWYVWAVDHGTVAQYGAITRSAINQHPIAYPAIIPQTGEYVPAPAR